ncbi:MAG: ATP-grasp domain-containing protein [Lachnospiraceae bacterium]|jgi:carbamoyl-phosphate synthase large subunit|nr:ATP-grasp domain-containing protein [Lachnospiraceae bacterium]
MKTETNILLTSAGRRTYLIEYFKEAVAGEGRVHAANSQICPAFAAADQWVITPLIYDENYIPFLLDYCRKNQITMLISLFDIDLPVLAKHRNEFAKIGVNVVVSDPEVVEVCNDKWKTFQFLSSNGLLTPKSFLNPEEAKLAVREGCLSYPLIVKPRWGMGSLSVFQADKEEELDIFYKKIAREIQNSYLRFEAVKDPSACVLIQEKIEGQEYGLDIINDLDCHYQNTIPKRKGAMRSGETDFAETVDNEDLKGLGERISSLLKHRGNLDMDVFEAGGKYYILEMNPRFGGGYPFSHAAGANFPKALVNWEKGISPKAEWLTARPGVKAYKDIKILVVEE